MARRRSRRSETQAGVRILAYHRVAAERDPLAVKPDAFRRQMEAILSHDVRVVGLDAALTLLARPVTEAFICVTFDDGYLDTLETAAPILRDLRIPATVFLPTAMIDGRERYGWYRRSPPPALTWDDAAELVRRRPHRRGIAFQDPCPASGARRRRCPQRAGRIQGRHRVTPGPTRDLLSPTRPGSTARVTPASFTRLAIAERSRVEAA